MTLTLVYDGGCLFCSQFALRSELCSGIQNFRIVDGRSAHRLRRELKRNGLDLAKGAVLLEGDEAWHGSAAVAELSRRMKPSDPLLSLLRLMFKSDNRAAGLYPCLLLAREAALKIRGLPLNPDQMSTDQS